MEAAVQQTIKIIYRRRQEPNSVALYYMTLTILITESNRVRAKNRRFAS